MKFQRFDVAAKASAFSHPRLPGRQIRHRRRVESEHVPASDGCCRSDVANREFVTSHMGTIGEMIIETLQRRQNALPGRFQSGRAALVLGEPDQFHHQNVQRRFKLRICPVHPLAGEPQCLDVIAEQACSAQACAR